MSKTLKCNPTWEWAGTVLIETIKACERAGNAEGAQDAADEITRALRGYDAMLAKHTNYFDES